MAANDHVVLQLRVALTSAEYDRLLGFYCDALGLNPAEQWSDAGEGKGMMFEMGKASLEIFNEAYAAGIDQVEVGRRVSGPVRFALQVPDVKAALERLISKGAVAVHPPVVTPWGDINARVQDPDGLQITLFQTRDLEVLD